MGHDYYREDPEEIYLDPSYRREFYEDYEREPVGRASSRRPSAPGNGGKKNRRKRKRSRALPVLIPVLILAVCVLVAVFGCKTEHLEITGQHIYETGELDSLLRAQVHSDNSIRFWAHYRFRYRGEIPFVGRVQVKLKGLKTLEVTVTEEDVVAYLDHADSRLYLDERGVLMENSPQELPGIGKVLGMEAASSVVGEVPKVEDPALLKSACQVMKAAGRYGMMPDSVSVDEKGDMSLYCGNIRCALGQAEHLEEKVALAAVLLPKLEGKTGILHLEDYDGTTGNRSFEDTEN